MAPSVEEYEQFVVARHHRLVRAAVLLGCRPMEAEDAAQDALVRCWTAWSRVARADDPDAYVYRVLVNGIARDRRRRRWRGEVPTASPPWSVAAPDHAGEIAVGESVRAALARLSPPHRAVLVLRYYADLTEQQTAEVLGVPRGTVKSRASRATQALAADPGMRGLLIPTSEEER